MKHYFRETVVQVTILSDCKEMDFDGMGLGDIAYQITEGECSGKVRVVSDRKITGKEMATQARAQGSDPSFFQIDDNGRSV